MYASKNGDKVPRTGKKYIDWYGYILVGGLSHFIGSFKLLKSVKLPN
jgi:hypothetical protein